MDTDQGHLHGSGKATRPAAAAFLIATVLIDAMAFALIIPVMPSLLMELTGEGVGNAAIWGGLATFVFAVMQFFFSPVIGGLSDRFGRRPVLLLSLTALCIDFLLMGLAHALWVFFIARTISGIFAATHSTANAYIADVTPAEQRSTRFAWLGAAMGVGFILGPVLGVLWARLIRGRLSLLPQHWPGSTRFMAGLSCRNLWPKTNAGILISNAPIRSVPLPAF